MEPKPTDKHKHMNHYHELTDEQEIVDFGTGKFIADKKRMPLLKALNEAGLITRSHCYGHETGHSFVGILMSEDVSISIHDAKETHSGRTFPEGMKEITIHWKRKD